VVPESSFNPPPTTTSSSLPGRDAAAAPTAGSGNKQLLKLPSIRYAAVLTPVSHSVEHHLVTCGLPISSKFRRLDGVQLAAAKAEFEKMELDGVVRRSMSPWASPLHMVEKSNGGWRPCGDFRRLNLVTVPDSYRLPNMMDFLSQVA
jgi:hypothetical protein